jgi:2-keto-3-deoxy-L-rhamnonate aldolase RhmA
MDPIRENTVEQAEAIVQAAKFPPLGKRGVAWSARSHLFGAGDRSEVFATPQ